MDEPRSARQSSIATCIDCPSGKYSGRLAMNSGFSCISCAIGRHGTGAGAQVEGSCFACAGGQYNPLEAQSSEAVYNSARPFPVKEFSPWCFLGDHRAITGNHE